MNRASDVDLLARLTVRVREETGFDLTGYRTDGLARRARQRAALVGAQGLQEYLPSVDAREARALLEHVLIQVSGWFRDAHVWTSLRETVLPGIARRRGGPVDLRVWVAGCGEGQEVWSLAACLDEAGRAGHLTSWGLLATDVDAGVLATLERGLYPVVEVAAPGEELLLGHLGRVGDAWEVGPSLSAHVRTAVHDVRAAPPPGLGGPADLVLCRNVIMYLDAGAQVGVLDGLVASMRPGGVLVLGYAEIPLEHRDVLVPVDPASRAYRVIGKPLPSSAPASGSSAPR